MSEPGTTGGCLGHARVSITLDRYSHVLPVMQEEAAARLDELITASR